ncbi:MAG: beta-galactosidase [Thermogutta sp.]|uniref:sugar-binding domain-containing protein n=1 Tax=Thermogutta sp. TaxID=1962930 RepID=UPI0019944A84|nr:sugar-binding domain-containing protein [Thermogutta sp.]MBC7351776.1 beta-galactosidase [Thermogutta sp.]
MKRLLLWTGVVIGLSFSVLPGRGESWKPAPSPLMTRWAKDVSPDRVWPEYPRPQMVREKWVNLNGLWDYAVTPKDASQPEKWDGQILVPFCIESALSGVGRKVQPPERLWYRRKFTAPELPDGGRLLLHFGAVDWQTTVWVNGRQVGEHTGGYDPFTFDITECLKPGENELVVAVWDPTDTGWQPRGKQVLNPKGIWYTAVTGIWQTVWLEPVPAQSIQKLKLVPDVDRERLVVTVVAPKGLTVHLKARFAGQDVAETSGPAGEAVELRIPQAKLWWPEEPNLYDLEVSLLSDGRVVDRVESYFGMRKVSVEKDENGINRLMLNGKFVFQYGPLDQGWWPDGLYTPASDEAMKFDIEMTKKFGMNMARKHVKYEPERWYYWCDKLGLLVWQDMPSGNADRNEESRANFRKELKAMIDARFNHPCIIMWIPFNEGWGQHDTCDIVKWIKEYDPSRVVNEASGWHDNGCGDISDMHRYPGPGVRPIEEKRACVLGEFGGLGMPIPGHLWKEQGAWGYVAYADQEALTDAYCELLAQVRFLIPQGLCAAVYTQTSDVEIEVNGLMTYDREVIKIQVDRAAEAARRLHLPPPTVQVLVATSEHQGQVWRYTTETPSENWMTPEFDDSAWKEGPGGFGTEGTPGAVVRTVWNTSDIWLRRSFNLEKLPEHGELALAIHHDEDAEVYLNGQLIKRTKGFLTGYTIVPLTGEAARKALKPGRNVLAVHCHQTRGGQYIDVGLSLIVEKE